MGIFVGILTIILGLLAASLPSYKPLISKKGRKTELTSTGILVLIILIFLVCLQVFQMIYGEVQNNLKEEKQAKELRERDSVNIVRMRQNTESISKAYADGFAKYGLKYDTAKKEIEKLVKDSLKTTVYGEIKPEMDFCDIRTEVDNDTLRNYINLCVKQATAYKCKFTIHMVSRDSDDKLFDLGTFFPISINRLTDGIEVTRTLFADRSNGVKQTMKFYYFLIGSYQDRNGKIYEHKQLIYYDLVRKLNGYLTPKEEVWLVDFYKKLGVS